MNLAHPKQQQQQQLLFVGSSSSRAGGGNNNNNNSNSSSEWQQMEDVEHGLAVNFEGSLAGLGVDLSTAAFNMSEAIMSLSPIKLAPGPPGSEASTLLAPVISGGGARFHFALSAGTSPAVKLTEEPLTYLNQGHPYEVKMACFGAADKSRLLKSVFRISFHDRRMQFMEKEHLEYWRQSRPGERILDIDIPLSYSLRHVAVSPGCINAAEAVWEAGVECGVFVKLHCVSTEFTARKHGGEKGIPFRLQVDTFDQASGDHLCSVAAQVKIFKPKGADRKHKTDREKVEKRTETERCKYQAALTYTPFHPAPFNAVAAAAPSDGCASNAGSSHGNANNNNSSSGGCGGGSSMTTPTAAATTSTPLGLARGRDCKCDCDCGGSGSVVKRETGGSRQAAAAADSPEAAVICSEPAIDADADDEEQLQEQQSPLPSWPPQRVADWLQGRRFPAEVTRALRNFNGADLARLSRADLLEICGLAEGVRLANCLARRRCVRPRLVLYVGQESENLFHPVYLSQLTYSDLFAKIAGLFQSDGDKISQILFYGPGGIPVCISDEMVGQMESEARLSLHVVPDAAIGGRFKIFVKPMLLVEALGAAAAAAAATAAERSPICSRILC